MNQTEMANALVKQGYDVRVGSDGELLVYSEVAGGGGSNVHPVGHVYRNMDQYKPIELPKNNPGNRRAQQASKRNYEAKMSKANRDAFDLANQFRREEAANLGGWDASMLHMGREGDKIVQGSKDLYDIAAFGLQRVPDRLLGTDFARDNYESMQQRKLQEAEKDALFQPVSDETSLSKLAVMPMYMSSGVVTRAPAKATSKFAINKAQKVAGAVDDATRGLAGRTLDKIATYDNIPGRGAQRIKAETIDPMRRRAAQKKAQPKYDNPYGVHSAEEFGTDIMQGGLEGLLHYDMNPLTGALSSMTGSAGAVPIRRYADKSPDLWSDPQQREILEWAKDHGYKATPGMETGSRAKQRFESSLRSEDHFSDIMSKWDADNQNFYNKIAWDAAGLEVRPGESMGDAIGRHKRDLQSQYQEIEAKTTGRISPELRQRAEALLERFGSNTDQQSIDAWNSISPFIEDMGILAKPVKGEGGKFAKQTFDGSQYQHTRQAMQAAKKKAFKDGDNMAGQALQDLINIFDDGLVAGMKDISGEASEQGAELVNRWKTLNQQYAVTDSLVESGSNVFGNFDPAKYQKHVMANDAWRTITGQGPKEIQELQKAVKLHDMERGQATSGLSGTGIRNIETEGRAPLAKTMVNMPFLGGLTPWEDMWTKMYLQGVGVGPMKMQPSVKGLLGTTRKPDGTLWDVGVHTRAGAMTAQPHQALMDLIEKLSSEDPVEQYIQQNQ